MLTINHLKISDLRQGNTLVDGLSMSLNENDKIAVIGTEGTGKSTLLKLLDGQELDYIEYSGQLFNHYRTHYNEQNISYRWNDETVYDFLHEEYKDALRFINAEIRAILKDFNLEYDLIVNRKIETFSGGEKVKLSLAKALISEPEILLMDEPTNDLDFETIEFLENFMRSTSIPLIFISHDQRLLENVANGIIHLQQIHKKAIAKSFFYRGTYQSYKERFFRQYTSDLQIAKKQRADYQKKMERFRKIYAIVEHQQNQAVRAPALARLLKKKIHALKSQEKRFEKEKENWTDIPEKEEPMNVFFEHQPRINPNKRILELVSQQFPLPNGSLIYNIELTLSGTDKVVIYGKNGVGKTTLLKHIVKTLEQKNIRYGYIPQNYMTMLDPNQRVVDFLIEKQTTYPEYRLRQILGQLGFRRKEMNEYLSSISEGQKLKVLLLLLVSLETEVLILDEPTRNISPINQDEIYNLFLNYPGAILAVTHDRAFIESVFDDIYELTAEGLVKK